MNQTDFSRRMRRNKFLSSSLILFTLAIGILIGTVISRDVGADDETAAAPDATPLTIPEPVALENQFTPIVKRVRPSVVNISVESIELRGSAEGPESEEGMEDFFRRFFGMPQPPVGGMSPRPAPRRRPGEGSGFVVDPKGYIITNKHVVADADRVRVRFPDEDEYFNAKVIGSDEETDLAVIKVDAGSHKMNPATIGNSDAVGVGDWAIAIGSPFGFRESVTVGIISAKSREVGSQAVSRPFQKFFQTDAAINPGNSGGPLVNIRGEVIGINTAIVSRSGSYEGLGFALPSNMAVDVYNQIIKYGRVSRGSIGISFSGNQDEALLRTYGAENGGVFVTNVTEGWPAEKAGIREEDIIVKIDGKSIVDGDELIAVVSSKPVGSTVSIDALRDGKPQSFEVTIADREELLRATYGGGPARPEAPDASEVSFGITAQNLTPTLRERLKFDEEGGVLITMVEPASFADDLGLDKNDVIIALNRKPVSSVNDVRKLQEELEPGDDVAFKVMRLGGGGWVTLYFAEVLPELEPDEL